MSALSGNHPIPRQIRNQVPLKRKGNPARFQKISIPAENGNEIWLLTLSDLLMLLLIFFVLLFAVILQRQNQAVATPLPAAPLKPATDAPLADTRPQPPQAVPDTPPKEAAASLEADLAGLLWENQSEQGITVERRSRSVIVTFPERIMFDSGRSQLKGSIQPLLEKVALFILDHPDISVEIQGHTDDRPISNPRFPSNWELSADRAAQVAKALARLGTDPARLSIRGFGEYHPRVANDNDLNRLKNRRVEIQFSLRPA